MALKVAKATAGPQPPKAELHYTKKRVHCKKSDGNIVQGGRRAFLEWLYKKFWKN